MNHSLTDLSSRLKPGRKPKQISTATTDSVHEAMKERKKLQNREAQRAYRMRKLNRISELEIEVQELHDVIAEWQRKYQELKAQNESLMQSTQGIPSKLTTQIQDLPENIEAGLLSSTPHAESVQKMSLQDSSINSSMNQLSKLIMKFEPMAAVSLDRYEISSFEEEQRPAKKKIVQNETESGCVFAGTGNFECVCKNLKNSSNQIDHLKDSSTNLPVPKTLISPEGSDYNSGYEIDFTDFLKRPSGCCQNKKTEVSPIASSELQSIGYKDQNVGVDLQTITPQDQFGHMPVESKIMTPATTESSNR